MDERKVLEAREFLSGVSNEYLQDDFDSTKRAAEVIQDAKVAVVREKARDTMERAGELFDDLLDDCYEDIHNTMQNYYQVISRIENSKNLTRTLSSDLQETKRLVSTSGGDNLQQLRFHGAQMKETVSILQDVQKLLVAGKEMETFLADRKFEEAATVVMEAVAMVCAPDFAEIPALGSLRRSLLDSMETAFRHFCNEFETRLLRPQTVHSRTMAGGGQPSMSSMEDDQEQLARVCKATLVLGYEHVSRLCNISSLSLQNKLVIVAEEQMEDALRVSTLAGDAFSSPLVVFFQGYLQRLLEIIKQHKFALEQLNLNDEQPDSSEKWARVFSKNSVWSTIQVQVQKQLLVHLEGSSQGSAAALQRSLARVAIVTTTPEDSRHSGDSFTSNEMNVSFSLNAARAGSAGMGSKGEIAGGSDGHDSRQAELDQDERHRGVDLVPVSSYHIIAVHDTVASFAAAGCQAAGLSTTQYPEAGMLAGFLDTYVTEAFMPTLLSDFKDRVQEAVHASEAFSSSKSSSISQISGAVLESAITVDAQMTQLFAVLCAMPEYISEVLSVMEGVLLRYIDAAHKAFSRALEDLNIVSVLQKAELLSMLLSDPCYQSLKEGTEFPEDSQLLAYETLERLKLDPALVDGEGTRLAASSLLDIKRVTTLAVLHTSLQFLCSRIKQRIDVIAQTKVSNAKGLPAKAFISSMHTNSTAPDTSKYRSHSALEFLVRQFSSSASSSSKNTTKSTNGYGQNEHEDTVLINVSSQGKRHLSEGLEDLCERLEDMARKSLFALRLLCKCQVHSFLDLIDARDFQRTQLPAVPDRNIVRLNQHIQCLDEALFKLLPENQHRYLFTLFPAQLASGLISGVAKAQARNSIGVQAMVRNIMAVKQNLQNLGSTMALRSRMLQRAHQYYELMELSHDDLLIHLQSHRGAFTLQEYQVLTNLSAPESGRDAALKKVTEAFNTTVKSSLGGLQQGAAGALAALGFRKAEQ